MSRSNVLKSVQQVLSSYQPLAELLNHDPQAESVEEGARVVGDTARLELNGRLPILILSFSDSAGRAPQREDKSWEVEVFSYSEDIFGAADVTDLVEEACLEYRLDRTLPQPLNHISPGPAERVASERGAGYLIEFRQPLSVRWIDQPTLDVAANPPVAEPEPSAPAFPEPPELEPPTYRYARLHLEGAGFGFRLAEVELLDLAGQNVAAAALSNASPPWNGTAPRLFDGDPQSYAQLSGARTVLSFELSAPLESLALTAARERPLKSFRFEVSGGETWRTLAEDTFQSAAPGERRVYSLKG